MMMVDTRSGSNELNPEAVGTDIYEPSRSCERARKSRPRFTSTGIILVVIVLRGWESGGGEGARK